MSEARTSLWRHLDFRRLWLATTVSQVGTQVSELAIPLAAIVLLHATPFEVGMLAALGYLPLALFGLPAGARVDRMQRRAVLLAADVARAVVLGSIPVAYAAGHLTIAQLNAVAFLVGAMTVFFDVAYVSYLPSLVSRDELIRANSQLQASEQGAAVVGPGLAGWLIGVLGAPFAVALDAASYVGSAAFVRRIRSREPGPTMATPPERMRTRIAEGLRYVAADRYLRAIATAAGVVNLFGRTIMIVVLIYLVRMAGYSATGIGVVFSVGSVGFLAGALLADRVVARVGIGKAIVGGGCVAAASFLLMAVPPPGVAGPFVAAGLAVYGLGALTFTISNATLRQATTPPEILGRVTSSMRVLVWVAQPAAGVLAGWLATAIGLRGAIWVSAIAALAAPLPLLLSGLTGLRAVGEKVPGAA